MRLRARLILTCLLILVPAAGRGQSRDDADDRRRGELLRELRTLAAQEQRALGGTRERQPTRGMAVTDDREQRERRQRIEALLDTLVLQRPNGVRELGALERAYPESPLLRRVRADLELRSGRPRAALTIYDALLRRAPRDASVARRRAFALAALHDTAQALQAWTAVLDAQPEDREVFDSLLVWRAATGSLDQLDAQLQRLRLFSVDSLLLSGRQAEVRARRDAGEGTP